jgi:hypothetical protein
MAARTAAWKAGRWGLKPVVQMAWRRAALMVSR